MRIKYAIVSTDANPYYADFWSVVSEIWYTKFNVIPVLAFIGDDDFSIDTSFGKVIRIKPIDGIPLHLQTQIVRFWIPSLFLDDVVIISDIDMLPISRNYFINTIEHLDNDAYCHINPCIDTYGRLPACYHIAKGSVFRDVLEIDYNWEIFLRKVITHPRVISESRQLATQWFADEIYSSFKVLSHKNNSIIKLINRKNGQNGYRIDRLHWRYNNLLLSYDYYYDAHSIRPFSEYSNEILSFKAKILAATFNRPPLVIYTVLETFSKVLFRFNILKSRIKNFINSITH